MGATAISVTTGLAEKLVNHWRTVLPGMQVDHEPYDHTYFEGFFPEDVYGRILQSFPAPENYQPLNKKRYVRAGGESTRDIMALQEEGIAHLDEELRTFWGELGEALGCDTFKRLVFDVLKRDVALRLGIKEEEAADAKAYVSTLLIRDTEEYKIKPHPDGFPRLVTMMLYLPEDASRDDLGTSVYVKNPVYMRLIGKKFREVKRFPFRPNSAAAFAVNDLPHRKSLHGRELIKSMTGARNVMIVSWFSELPEGEKSKKLQAEPVHHRIG